MLLAGALLLGTVTLRFLDARRLYQLEEQALHAAQPKAAPAVNYTPEQLREQSDRIKGINHHVRELNLPWDQMLGELRPPRTMPVYLLRVDAGPDRVRLTTEANQPASLLAYLKHLGKSHHLEQAYLVSHKTKEGGPEGTLYQFRIEAQWKQPRTRH